MLRGRRIAFTLALCGLLALAPAAHAAPRRFFSPNSFWNRHLARHASLAPDSALLVAHLQQTLETANPWIATWGYSTPVYRVGRHQRRVRVKPDYSHRVLPRAFSSVPMPGNAQPALGHDRHLVVVQRSTDT